MIIMIHKGDNISLINNNELECIKQNTTETIPTLPVHNITLIGATRHQNKTARKQVLLDTMNGRGKTSMRFMITRNISFEMLIDCDMLRQYSTVIDIQQEKLLLTTEDREWTAQIIGHHWASPVEASYYICEDRTSEHRQTEYRQLINSEEDLWKTKIQKYVNSKE